MKKLGAVREGVLRADRITWTGHVRDTVLFAILKDEWPSWRTLICVTIRQIADSAESPLSRRTTYGTREIEPVRR